MELGLYGDDSKGVVKLDPRTKMLLFLTSSIVSLNLYSDVAIILYNTALCLLMGLCGKRVFALGAGAVFLVMVYLRWCIQSQGTGSAELVSLVQVLITVFLFAFPVAISLLMLIQTTRISQFLAAFQAMRLPAAAVIPVAVILRFIPTVQDEWAGIRKAMAFRGIRMGLGSVVRHPGQAAEHMLVPLLFSSVSVMEELAAAAEARGLDADGRRTSYEEVRLHAIDYVVMTVFSAIAASVLCISIAGVA